MQTVSAAKNFFIFLNFLIVFTLYAEQEAKVNRQTGIFFKKSFSPCEFPCELVFGKHPDVLLIVVFSSFLNIMGKMLCNLLTVMPVS